MVVIWLKLAFRMTRLSKDKTSGSTDVHLSKGHGRIDARAGTVVSLLCHRLEQVTLIAPWHQLDLKRKPG